MKLTRKMNSLVLSLMGLVLVASCNIWEEPDPAKCRNKQKGSSLPNFTIEMNDGSSVTDESLLGHTSVIMFFDANNTWECDKQLQEIQKVYDRYGDDEKVKFVLMSRDNSPEEVEACWKRNKLTMPYSVQTDHYIYYLFAEYGIPKLYVTCYKNVIWYFHDGAFVTEKGLASEIDDAKEMCC